MVSFTLEKFFSKVGDTRDIASPLGHGSQLCNFPRRQQHCRGTCCDAKCHQSEKGQTGTSTFSQIVSFLIGVFSFLEHVHSRCRPLFGSSAVWVLSDLVLGSLVFLVAFEMLSSTQRQFCFAPRFVRHLTLRNSSRLFTNLPAPFLAGYA
jgi:hypothetical protein